MFKKGISFIKSLAIHHQNTGFSDTAGLIFLHFRALLNPPLREKTHAQIFIFHYQAAEMLKLLCYFDLRAHY